MFKRLHWLVLRKLPGPFIGWLGTLMFLLLMQFLIRWLPELAGKGLPLLVIVELIVYNLAYMLVLAVPMSVLLASLMAYGQLAESQAYVVIKSAGVSLMQLIWPTLIAGLLITSGMAYFNNVVLPEANYRARNLWVDVRSKRPGFELQPGVFYEGLDGYSILVQERPPNSNRLLDVTIYDYTAGRDQQAVIKAKRGRLVSKYDGTAIDLILHDGEMHRKRPPGRGQRAPRYEQLAFDRHTLRLDLSDFVFERKSEDGGSRTDRTTPTLQMLSRVDSMRATVRGHQDDLHAILRQVVTHDTTRTPRDYTALPRSARTASRSDTAAHPTTRVAVKGLSRDQQRNVHYTAYQRARTLNSDVSDIERNVRWQQRRINQYMVEIYKKSSIAVACLIFTLIGAPLGLTIRRGGLGPVGGYSLGIFLFYWVTLVQGEKLADRGLLPPWLGMWIANAIMLVVGTWLVLYVVMDLRATPPLRRRLWAWIRSKFE
jgi:lipopolysaccharide export system permease protein